MGLAPALWWGGVIARETLKSPPLAPALEWDRALARETRKFAPLGDPPVE